MKINLTVVTFDDWDAIYVNGDLVSEDHSFYFEQAMGILERNFGLPLDIMSYESKDVDGEWFDGQDGFPEELSHVKFDD
jgi:hypothetical protein